MTAAILMTSRDLSWTQRVGVCTVGVTVHAASMKTVDKVGPSQRLYDGAVM